MHRFKVLCIHSRYTQMSWLQYQVQQTSYESLKGDACFHVIMYWSVATCVTNSATSVIRNMSHTNASNMNRAYLAAIQVKVSVKCEDKILTCEQTVEPAGSPVTHIMLWWQCWYWNSQYLPSVINLQTLCNSAHAFCLVSVGQYNIVGVMTHYGLESLGIDIFCICPDWSWSWGSPNLLYSGCQLCFPGVQQLGRGIDHLPPSGTKVKEGVELYTSTSPLGLHSLLYSELYIIS
jgi:hypothetical protein